MDGGDEPSLGLLLFLRLSGVVLGGLLLASRTRIAISAATAGGIVGGGRGTAGDDVVVILVLAHVLRALHLHGAGHWMHAGHVLLGSVVVGVVVGTVAHLLLLLLLHYPCLLFIHGDDMPVHGLQVLLLLSVGRRRVCLVVFVVAVVG